ncbi:MAG: serine hydrolase [bacterium]|nr:serine hydrolase [bacterium]
MDIGFSGSVIVSISDSIILQKGYGWTYSTQTVPITPRTRFYLASTTKGVTPGGIFEIWSRGGESFGHNSAVRWFKNENVVILILTNCGQLKGESSEANRTVSNKIRNLIPQLKVPRG